MSDHSIEEDLMEQTILHPLRRTEARLARALSQNGMTLLADGQAPEMVKSEWCFDVGLFMPEALSCKPVRLESNRSLKTCLLAPQLPNLCGVPDIAHFCVGTVYDARQAAHPGRARIQGIWKSNTLFPRAVRQFWDDVAQAAFGFGATTEVTFYGKHLCTVQATVDGASFQLAFVTAASDVSRSIVGLSPAERMYTFVIDLDAVTCALCGLADRDELYDPTAPVIGRADFASSESSWGSPDAARACNLLRRRGFLEFNGIRAYEQGCYKKMNMIQEKWDTNNRGMMMSEPLGEDIWLPTVLTPSLEEALSANWSAGVGDCMLFELGHIYKPAKLDYRPDDPTEKGNFAYGVTWPTEKVSLSLGAYGCDLTPAKWKSIVDEFLTAFGIHEHYLVKNDQAPAYDPAFCWLVLDENMRYLDGNLGRINPIATRNHDIGAPAYMAQFEFDTLQRKAAEERTFVPKEDR